MGPFTGEGDKNALSDILTKLQTLTITYYIKCYIPVGAPVNSNCYHWTVG
jgi:hypothetical protein